MSEIVIAKSEGSWYWRCKDCGWLGINLYSESFAKLESSNHVCPDRAEVSR